MLDVEADEPPNLLRYLFTQSQARATYPDWSEVADREVAHLHRLREGDSRVEAFAMRLGDAAGDEFSERWRTRPLPGGPEPVTRIDHPQVGTLRLSVEPLVMSGGKARRLHVYLPADSATASGLDRLAGLQPGALRSVPHEL